jgi:hypothetical protein
MNPGFEGEMTRFQLAVLVVIGAAFLAAPLSALCSSCCVAESAEDAMSVPMPCCDGSCGPSFTAARPRDPAMASPKTRLDQPLSIAALRPQAVASLVLTGSLAAILPATATESPPVTNSVLRL